MSINPSSGVDLHTWHLPSALLDLLRSFVSDGRNSLVEFNKEVVRANASDFDLRDHHYRRRIGIFELAVSDAECIEHLLSFRRAFPDAPLVGVIDARTLSSRASYACMLCDRLLDATEIGTRDAIASIVTALSAEVQVSPPAHAFGDVVFRSASMRKTLQASLRAARAELPVFISGPTGAGKEMIAKLMHHVSRRADRPFVAVNCAAIPRELFDTYLFGYAKGAFTGATSDTTGVVQRADGGTLFLDEVGELPTEVQAKLNRFADVGEYRPVGSSIAQRSRVFLISATHRNLKQLCAQGQFNAGLFERLSQAQVWIDALVQRPDDIAPLAWNAILQRFDASNPTTWKCLSNDAIEFLCSYAWPGNARQLANSIDAAATFTHGYRVSKSLLERVIRNSTTQRDADRDSTRSALDTSMREYFLAVLEASGGCVARAAKMIKASRSDLYRLLDKYDIKLDGRIKTVNDYWPETRL
ncbi:MAG: sigma 54-interacting transcriptional regulator [Casimicrobium sp.]